MRPTSALCLSSTARAVLAVLSVPFTACPSSPVAPGTEPSSDAEVSQDLHCRSDADCADARWCNGYERCIPDHPEATAFGCVSGSPACNPDEHCEEDRQQCGSTEDAVGLLDAAGVDASPPSDAGPGPGLDGGPGWDGSSEAAPSDAPGTASDCRAGYYAGTWSGEYWSYLFDPVAILLDGGGSLSGANVATSLSGVGPGLSFALRPSKLAPSMYEVSDGCLVAVLSAAGTDRLFVASVSGTLDCKTGEFEGHAEGHYEWSGGTGPIFEGPLAASYADGAFQSGLWDVREASESATAPGGWGNWEATWWADLDAAPALPSACQALQPSEG